jgi:hypothetical protein
METVTSGSRPPGPGTRAFAHRTLNLIHYPSRPVRGLARAMHNGLQAEGIEVQTRMLQGP